MPKRVLSALLALACLLPLSACGGSLGDREREEFLAVRGALLEKESLELRADLRADYGDRAYDFRLSYRGNAEGGTLEVEEPLELTGVAVELEEGHARLRYGDLMLDTGALTGGESPLQCFPLLIRSWLRGSVSQCWRERRDGVDCIAAEMHLGEAGAEDRLLCRTWFRREHGAPVFAELASQGRTCLTCVFLAAEETG